MTQLICKDLNNNIYDIREKLKTLKYFNDSKFEVLNGNSKVDVRNEDIRLQIKKYTNRGFGQLDRHWVKDLIGSIQELKPIEKILVSLCELPLCEDNNKCDKSKSVIKLCSSNYSDEELNIFLKTLNNSKRDILEYVFYGNEIDKKPDFIIGIQYIKDKRSNITIYST